MTGKNPQIRKSCGFFIDSVTGSSILYLDIISTNFMMQLAELPLPKGTLLIDYQQPADKYFQYETAPRDALSRLAFLGAVTRLKFQDTAETIPTNAENLQKAGIGRKSLSGVVDSVLLCDAEHFKILDGAENVMKSHHFTFDGIDVEFDDSDADIYANTIWSQNVEDKGRIQAYIDDIKNYCKVGGKKITDQHLSATVPDGGIGWFLGALLLRVSINQGKFELSIPTLLSSSQNGAVTTS